MLALLFCGVTAGAEPVDFPLLPALPSERADEGLLLEVAREGERMIVVGELGRILYSGHPSSLDEATIAAALR